jgi:3-dehydroquinate synthase
MASTLAIDLGERSYRVVVGRGPEEAWVEPLRPLLAGRRVAVVTDARVSELYRAAFDAALGAVGVGEASWHIVPEGETSKSMETLAAVYDGLLEARLGRDGWVCALGGGVVGDLAGFAAATLHRGVPWVQVPTTLLAMVDSAIGGKTGINHRLGKNLIGAFHQPRVVAADLDTLETLPRHERANGFAEIIKYGVISDAALFEVLEDEAEALLALSSPRLLDIVLASARIKAEVVVRDEREAGLRMILNFGHTLGHAIERTAGFGSWSHGQAVAVGMVLVAALGAELGLTPASLSARLAALCRRFELPTELDPAHRAALAGAIGHDKKVRGERVQLVVAKTLGEVVVEPLPLAQVRAWLTR